MMVGIGAGMRPIYTSPITINAFSVIVKRKLADILRPTPTSFNITPTISSLIFRCNQQSTMVTWDMGERVAGMGPISTSPITTNSLSFISRVKFAGFFRPISTSNIIKFYIPLWVAILTTYISPTIIIIIIIGTDITPLFFVDLFLCTMRRNW